MFKSLGNLIYRTPWWGLAFGGLFILLALVMFATPIHLLRLSDSGKTPAEKSAIKREINLAFGGQALNIAESVVSTMKARATDPDRIRELDRALAEMARARDELSKAQSRVSGAGSEAARSAADAALETAMTAAESAVESATDAREAIAEAKDEAVTKLRSKGLDTSSTARSFDELLQSAKDSEKTAREALTAIEALQHDAPPAAGPAAPPQVPPAPVPPKAVPALPPAAAPPAKPSAPSTVPGKVESPAAADKSAAAGATKASRKIGPKATIVIDLDSDLPAGAMLSPEIRDDIRAKVAGDVWRIGVGSALILLFIPLFVVLLIAKYYIGRSRRALAFAEEKKQEAKLSDVSRQVTEARLQALQAQVEPHFLYNTLANVQALTEFDPPAANAMVGHLIQYLRAALPKMRESTSTIGQEVELVTAYLNILKMRMGSRLEFGIDVASELLTKSFPPMMLPSLVENAIKHGLEPLREGGRIDVIATRVTTAGGERIRLQVRDTGRGLAAAPVQAGGGIGLTNLRERLAGLYGNDARFTIESNVPQGVVATIEIPVEVPVEKSSPMPGAEGVKAATAAPAAPATGWRRAWQATSKTHSVWAWIASRLFFGLMFLLALVFLLALIGLYTGWMPVDIGDLQLHGIEGMALGSVLLLVGFAVSALAIAIVVAVFYGLGFLFAGLLVLVPAIILISLFPVLAPFILIGLAIYWFWWKKRKTAGGPGAV
ncbi:MAG: histidine kinase [Betaproteobacteria bacterium]|nr:histidine kinase [Betaproteobacteria bacterium]